MKIATIVGARPQFIKAATVSRVIRERCDISENIIHTGQHYDSNMSAQFFSELDIPEPAYYLNIGSGTHGKQTGLMLAAVEEILLKDRPDWVLVYGDTNSTLAGALAAAKLHIPVAHVEAGLRSFNRHMPEEINRVMTDHLSSLLFAPTQHAVSQLKHEGIDESKILNSGDVMFDATLFYNEKNTSRTSIFETMSLEKQKFCLATIHRAENTDDEVRLRHIVAALSELGSLETVVLPLHPRTQSKLTALGLLESLQNSLMLIEPIGYLDMLALERNAKCIITDSGGVQKEAYFNRVPCITLRDETEWVELVESGWNQLCSPKHAFSLCSDISSLDTLSLSDDSALYGSGEAAQKIVDRLLL